MGSAAFTDTKTADQRTILDTGSVGQFAAPDSQITNPNSQALTLGTNAKVYQTTEGLAGGDVAQLFSQLMAGQQGEREQVKSIADSALGALSTVAASAQAGQQELATSTKTGDWQKWLPFVVLAVILVVYLGAK